MTKRTAPALFLLLLCVTTLSAAETGRYVVMMKRGTASARPKTLLRDIVAADAVQRDLRELDIINGFAASLTTEEAAAMRRQPDVGLVEPVAVRYAFGT